ncbi:WXG100 family type VII secretion target [Dietzia cinnamea]|uniref:WXG100 family type VII secretion target n=1 Tax=Dietzia cinnamea TaxID=321318 RepID=UPI00223BC20C|nr:WXG100 family type VII secretion target [Dietzia cinnamea]MCT2172938.1 WXG100 family type VII secretion target [Dietzia cinnamea]
MSWTVGDIRRWDVSALTGAGGEVGRQGSVAQSIRGDLVDGAAELDDGWDGEAADAVLDTVEREKSHVSTLADGLEDLADALRSSHAALGPAVQTVRDRIADAEAAGLQVGESSVRPLSGRDDIGHSAVDEHAEAISSAVDTVRSLDEHYGREIDQIAARLHSAIPPEVDRSPIPGPDDPWPGRGVDAMTGAASRGYPDVADELDPRTRGRHMLNPAPDDFGSAAATGLRGLGRVAGPVGGGLTVYDGVKAHAEGRTSTGEAVAETLGALGGGALGGAAAGAVAGTMFGPLGTFIGAGIGAAVGTYLGQQAGDMAHHRYRIHTAER